MKKHGKILAITAAIVMCLTMAFGLAACGDGAVKATNVYSTGGKYSSVPDSPQGLAYVTSINVTVYSDNTYMLVEEQGGYMTIYGGTEVGHFTSVFYGTFTQEDGTEENTVTVKLSKPTRIVYRAYVMSGGTAYYDTDNAATFAESEDVTAESLLGKGKEFTLTVKTDTNAISAGVAPGDIVTLFNA